VSQISQSAPHRSVDGGLIMHGSEDVPVWTLIKRLVADHIKPHLWRIGIAVALMIVVAGTTTASVWLLETAVRDIFEKKIESALYWVPPAIMAVMLARAGAMYLSSWLLSFVGLRIVADMQIKLYESVLHADLSRLNDTHSGRFTANFLNDTQMIRRAVSSAVTDIFRNVFIIIGALIYIYTTHVVMAILATLILPFVGGFTRSLGKKTRKATKKQLVETGTMSTLISESLDGIRVVKAYRQEERELDRMTDSVNRRFVHQLKGNRAKVAAVPMTEALTGIALALVAFYGGYEGFHGRLDFAQFTAVVAAAGFCYQPVRSLSGLYPALTEGLAAAARVFAVMDVKPEISDDKNAPPLSVREGRLSFDNVTFAYPDGTTALADVTLTAEPYKTTALVGPSGAGKSTILNLIPRFYDVTNGHVTIDGQDTRTVSLSSLRDNISIVTQEPFLFDDTITANIAYAKPGASEAQIREAAERAAADDFIRTLPSGYDTVVGEAGVKLSGGQRQRIAIARAFLADAPLLLLDEATSALDTESERKVQEALNTLMSGRTTIVIAHRLSTVIDADRIYVLDHGRIAEQGSHDELLSLDGLYAKLYSGQLRGDAPQAED